MNQPQPGGLPVVVQPQPQPQTTAHPASQPQTTAHPAPTQPQGMPQMDPKDMISPEQQLAGVVKFYHTFARTEGMYRMINDTISGKRKLPLGQYPSGKTLPDGQQEVYELDWHLPFAKMQDPQQQAQALKTTLGPMNNYLAQQYSEDLQQLSMYALNAFRVLSGENEVQALQGQSFDQLLQTIHESYAQFEPQYQVLKQIEDGASSGNVEATLGGVGINLDQLLAAANVAPENRGAVINSVLGNKLSELRGGLIPCLRPMVAAALTAVAMISQSQQRAAN